jgi:hypothetical protein
VKENTSNNKDDYFGKTLTISDKVVYIGEGEDPAKDPYMIAYAKALKEVYGKDNQSGEKQ